ncbi:hypothetical protein EG831_07455, partial [bacterium]|nr:hypothetical protein [bacterium]
MSLLGSIKHSLAQTRAGLFGKIAAAVGGRTVLTAAELSRLEELLLAADVGVAATGRLLAAVEQGGGHGPAVGVLKQAMRSILAAVPD